jgi:alkanesulfonate monooxygenase SsuD/methylene tetrahydromethanopterin reductase-like flavin-dependent oxidoreductase (luciferase family)
MNPIADAAELERQLALLADIRGGLPKERPILREVCVAESDHEAFELARNYLVPKYETYARWGMIDEFSWDEENSRFFTGSPARVRQQIEAFIERIPTTHILFRVQWPGVPHAQAKRSLQLLASDVLQVRERVAS